VSCILQYSGVKALVPDRRGLLGSPATITAAKRLFPIMVVKNYSGKIYASWRKKASRINVLEWF